MNDWELPIWRVGATDPIVQVKTYRHYVQLNVCLIEQVFGNNIWWWRMAVTPMMHFKVEVLDDGVYSVAHVDYIPEPLVILINKMRATWICPDKEVTLRFQFAS